MSATSRPDSMTEATTDNLNEVNFPKYFRHRDSYNAPSVNNATKKSFKSVTILFKLYNTRKDEKYFVF